MFVITKSRPLKEEFDHIFGALVNQSDTVSNFPNIYVLLCKFVKKSVDRENCLNKIKDVTLTMFSIIGFVIIVGIILWVVAKGIFANTYCGLIDDNRCIVHEVGSEMWFDIR